MYGQISKSDRTYFKEYKSLFDLDRTYYFGRT